MGGSKNLFSSLDNLENFQKEKVKKKNLLRSLFGKLKQLKDNLVSFTRKAFNWLKVEFATTGFLATTLFVGGTVFGYNLLVENTPDPSEIYTSILDEIPFKLKMVEILLRSYINDQITEIFNNLQDILQVIQTKSVDTEISLSDVLNYIGGFLRLF